MRALPSPCVGICSIDDQSGLCEGCYRSAPEIAAWPVLLDGERQQLALVLVQRKAEALATVQAG